MWFRQDLGQMLHDVISSLSAVKALWSARKTSRHYATVATAELKYGSRPPVSTFRKNSLRSVIWIFKKIEGTVQTRRVISCQYLSVSMLSDYHSPLLWHLVVVLVSLIPIHLVAREPRSKLLFDFGWLTLAHLPDIVSSTIPDDNSQEWQSWFRHMEKPSMRHVDLSIEPEKDKISCIMARGMIDVPHVQKLI